MHRTLSAAALLAATLALAACGAAASPSPSASAAATSATSPSAAATTDSSPTESAASASAGATHDASGAPSGELPGFSLPSGAQELEAVLPDEICGTAAQKFSLSGKDFEEDADPEMQAVLDEIGASASDVSMAVAGSATAGGDACGAGILRIAGANTDQIRTAFLAATEQEGDTITEQQLAGRTVYTVVSAGDTQHVYFTGDAIVFVSAPEGELEGLLSELP
jgi:hypothetical protein